MAKAKRVDIKIEVSVREYDPYNTKPISTVAVVKSGEFTTEEITAYVKTATNEVRAKALSDLADIQAKEDEADTAKG